MYTDNQPERSTLIDARRLTNLYFQQSLPKMPEHTPHTQAQSETSHVCRKSFHNNVSMQRHRNMLAFIHNFICAHILPHPDIGVHTEHIRTHTRHHTHIDRTPMHRYTHTEYT